MDNQEFYSVEDLTGILNLHPKTIRRFIREGKIQGRKIGRTWKVHRDELKEYAHAELKTPAENPNPLEYSSLSGEERIRVSTVIELMEREADEASRISNSLIAMLNCKDPSWGPVRYDMMYEKESRKARFVLYGSPAFIKSIMGFFEIIATQNTENTREIEETE